MVPYLYSVISSTVPVGILNLYGPRGKAEGSGLYRNAYRYVPVKTKKCQSYRYVPVHTDTYRYY